MITFRNILVATDFSEPSDIALAYGRALAHTFAATLHVVHVVGTLNPTVYGAEAYLTFAPQMQRALEDAARQQLDQLLVDNDPERPPVRRVLLVSDASARAVVEYAGEAHIDLVVTGTHGRAPMAQLIVGSVAERIVRTAPCPVLTVRHPDHEFVVPDTPAAVAES